MEFDKIQDAFKYKIREVITLGRETDASKPPPTLVRFSHPSERNQVLTFSKNLSKEINLEKSVPKSYQKKYKEFKRTNWKLKNLNYQTQIIFDGHNLVLRYKTKDPEFLFSNYDSFFPEPEDVTTEQPRAKQPASGKQYTLPISTGTNSPISRTVIISGILTKLSPAEMKDKFKAFLQPVDVAMIEEIEAKENGVITLVGRTWQDAETMSKKYHGKDFLGSKIVCTLFCDKNPTE